jgi:Ser/Thr protein kinase RdoA (MazF antagonist)
VEPLSLFNDVDFYRQHFMNAGLWEPYLRIACKKASLACRQVSQGLPGTYPAFIVDSCWVVKFFGRLFEGDESFKAELQANQIVAGCAEIPTPPLVSQGRLFDGDADWSWPFLIFQYLPGVSLGEVFDHLADEGKQVIAAQMGKVLRALHNLPINPGPAFQPTWERSKVDLEWHRNSSIANHRAWGILSNSLVEQIDGFLVPIQELIDEREQPYLIHGDLTTDHLLGQVVDGRWKTSGLIDWGDAWVGGFYYELVALYLDMFRAEPGLLDTFLSNYEPGPELLENFPQRALSAVLIHQFNVFDGPWYTRRMDCQAARSLEELANRLFGQVC